MVCYFVQIRWLAIRVASVEACGIRRPGKTKHTGNTMSKESYVVIKGAREHNLKNVSLEIPRDKLVVFTGVSGSGKSSLAFGTLYAEAQRRYLESVSPYAR